MAADVMLQSCGNKLGETITLTKSKVESEFASSADLVIENMIKTYKQVQDLSFQNEFDCAVAGVLSSNDETLAPTSMVNDTIIRMKINILYLYKQAFHEYSVMVDDGFVGKQSAFSKCCQAIAKEYTRLGDSAAMAASRRISGLVKASRYDENAAASYLVQALGLVWSSDINKWIGEFNASFAEYQKSILAVPESAFNEDKLQKSVAQPYDGKHNLVQVYKINQIKERRDEINNFIKCQDNITLSVDYLNQALNCFKSNDIDKSSILNYINRVNVLMGENSSAVTESDK